MNLSVARVFDIEVMTEICCDYCCEVIHNHITCPICKDDYAPTTAYHSLSEHEDKEVTCENCKSTFKLLSEYWYDYDELIKVQLVENI
jgi:transposase-like protein